VNGGRNAQQTCGEERGMETILPLSLKPTSSGERDEFCGHERRRCPRLNSGVLEPALSGVVSFCRLKQDSEEFSALSGEESFI
jgi:hypothetical protein